MKKNCVKCGKTFLCHSENITKCHCYSVKLSNDQIKKLKTDFNDCLCSACLEKIVKGK